MGTPAYLAPEYVRTSTATPRSDVYQLGLIIAELLTGRQAVQFDDLYACLHAHCEGKLNIDTDVLSGPFGEIVARATSKEPALRFEDAGSLREALLGVRLETGSAAPRRQRYFLWSAAAAAAALCGALVWGVLPPGSTRTAATAGRATTGDIPQSVDTVEARPATLVRTPEVQAGAELVLVMEAKAPLPSAAPAPHPTRVLRGRETGHLEPPVGSVRHKKPAPRPLRLIREPGEPDDGAGAPLPLLKESG